MVEEEKAAGAYKPKFFTMAAYQTLRVLCPIIIPPDQDVGGALEAGAPEFIDLLTSENPAYQLTLGGGIAWLDATCTDRFGSPFAACNAKQQKEILDLLAFRENAAKDPALGLGVDFFALLRDLTADAFFTSRIGIEYLGYIGNTYLPEFPGCPPLPDSGTV